MKPRITITINDRGELEVFLNPAGRDLLVRELLKLNERSDHCHLAPEDIHLEVPTQSIPYRDNDRIIEWGKILFRPDEWDAEYFPHVLTQGS